MAVGWQDIRDETLRRIQSRDWPPGSFIPNETALAKEFGCARATVNRALQALADAGWLERRRKAGTRVTLSPQRRAQLAIPLIRQEIESRGQSFGHTILERTFDQMPQHLRAALSLEGACDALHVRTLYQANARAFALEDRWVNLAAIPAFREAPLTEISANEWLVQNAPFSHGTLDYSASAASPDEAAHLICAPGTPLMVLERRTFSPDAPITIMRLSYAPGHHLHLSI
jgi:GntR family transcriptional regulator, histidine utilization repressor